MATYSVLHFVYSGTLDGITLKAPSDKSVAILGVVLSFEQWGSVTYPVDDKNWSFHFEFGRSSSEGTGSTLTPVQFDTADPASGSSIKENSGGSGTQIGIVNVKAGDTKELFFPVPLHLAAGEIFATYVTPSSTSSFEYTFKTTLYYVEN